MDQGGGRGGSRVMTSQSRINARSLRKHLFVGVAASVLIGGGIAAWAAATGISGAVVAPRLLH